MNSRLREFAERARAAAEPYVTVAADAASARALALKDQATEGAAAILNPLAERAAARVDETIESLTATLNHLTAVLDDKRVSLQERNAVKKEELRDLMTELQDQFLAYRMATAKPQSEAEWLQLMSAEVDKVVPRAQTGATAANQDDPFAALADMFRQIAEMVPAADGAEPITFKRDPRLEALFLDPPLKRYATPAPSHVRPLKLNEKQLAEALDRVQTILEAAYPKTKAANAPAAKAPAHKARKSGLTQG